MLGLKLLLRNIVASIVATPLSKLKVSLLRMVIGHHCRDRVEKILCCWYFN